MFHVGQKVVCVDADAPAHPYVSKNMHGLTKGSIYTVRETGLSSWIDGAPCIRLNEIIRPRRDFRNNDNPFWVHRFRPIIEHKTDISIFTEMLTPSPARVRELCGND